MSGFHLLVSVRNLAEAILAARQNVSVIDLKEPANGPLGRADPTLASRIASGIGDAVPLSLAMGELGDYTRGNLTWLEGYSYAKIGLSEMCRDAGFVSKWQSWANDVSSYCRPVVVSYADWQQCRAPSPAFLAQLAIDVQAPFFLMDTWSKNGAMLLDYAPLKQISKLVDQLVAGGVRVALAGSLDFQAIVRMAHLPIDIIGVRGIACRCGNRNSSIDPQRLDKLKQLLRSLPAIRRDCNSVESRYCTMR